MKWKWFAVSLGVGWCASGMGAAQALRSDAQTDTLHLAQDCLQCHAPGADLSRFGVDPTLMVDSAKQVDHRIDPRLFAQSNHGTLACRICHIVGKEVYPHRKEVEGNFLACTYCHDGDSLSTALDFAGIEEQFKASVHWQKNERTRANFDCYTCHDPHVFDRTEETTAVPEVIRRDNTVCLNCHDNPANFEAVTDREFPYIRVTHEWLPNAELHWDHVRCVECHTPHTERFSHKILAKEESEHLCAACHSKDSILATTLYKHQFRESRRRRGFINAAILGDAYVIGMTRNAVLDRWSLRILWLVLIGLCVHGGLRALVAAKRRSRR